MSKNAKRSRTPNWRNEERQQAAIRQSLDDLFRAARRSSPSQALVLYEMLAQGTQSAAAAALDRHAESLWDLPDARPHLQALFGAACSLWLLDRHAQAAEKLRVVLQLDPADHQFARYWLASCLFELERHDELRELLTRHDEPTAVWRYLQALAHFRLQGDDERAPGLLREARELDPRFLDYLLGEAGVDASHPVSFEGSPEQQTHSLARLFLPAWRSTPGAASWARQTLKVPLLKPADDELPFPRDALRQLPQRQVTWQMGLRLMDEDDDERQAVWLLAIGNIDDQEMPLMTVLDEEPTPQRVWQQVLTAMRGPMQGEPHRPRTLEVPHAPYREAWRAMLGDISVECVHEEDPQPIGELTAAMAEIVKQQRLPSLDESIDPLDFPQTDEVWQADFHHSSMWITNEQVGANRPWVALVLDKAANYILSNEVVPGEPCPELMEEYLVRTMAHPGPRPACRPAVVELADSDAYDFLKPKLAAWGIQCLLLDELPEMRDFCAALAAGFETADRCALADGKGVEREQMEDFYQEAAGYFKAAPWKHVPGEVPIRIDCSGLDLGTRYAIILGRTGVQLGLALYDDRRTVESMLRGLTAPEELAALTVLYDEAAIMAGADLHLVERNGWPIAAPEAYPVAMRIDGQQTRAPSAEELRLLVGCLRELPDYVKSDRDSKVCQIEAGDQCFRLRFAWKPLL